MLFRSCARGSRIVIDDVMFISNRAPVAAADTASVDEDGTVLIDVRANDTDVDGDALTLASVGTAAHGSVAIEGGALRYTPNANYNGSDSFSYTITDAGGLSSSATVNVTVRPVNDAPVAAADTASVDEDGTVLIDVRANDSDIDGDALTLSIESAPGHGAATVENGRVRYVPAPGYSGTDRFTYRVTDAAGATSLAAVDVTVNAVNNRPLFALQPRVPLPNPYRFDPPPKIDATRAVEPLRVGVASMTGRPSRPPAPQQRLWVDEFSALLNGFAVRFSDRIDSDGALDNRGAVPAVQLTAPDGRNVEGVVAMDDDGRGFRFTASAPSLPPGTYEIRILSGTDAVHSFHGILDGDNDGQPGGDYRQRFTIEADQARRPAASDAASAIARLWVERFVPALDGFSVRYNDRVPRREGGDGPLPPSVRMVGPDGRAIDGHIAPDTDGHGFRFVVDGAALAPGDYEVTLLDGVDSLAARGSGVDDTTDAADLRGDAPGGRRAAVPAVDFDQAYAGFMLGGAMAFGTPSRTRRGHSAAGAGRGLDDKDWRVDLLTTRSGGAAADNRSLSIRPGE